jgi:hypothetical protein
MKTTRTANPRIEPRTAPATTPLLSADFAAGSVVVAGAVGVTAAALVGEAVAPPKSIAVAIVVVARVMVSVISTGEAALCLISRRG